MPAHRSDLPQTLLNADLDLALPFTTTMARAGGLTHDLLARLVAAEMVRHPVRGVYVLNELADSLELRANCVRLLVPPSCVVTDRSAAWLHGAPMALAPGDHLRVPRLSVFHVPGNRLRNDLIASGERRLASEDVVGISGIRVTTPLRTACDLGRLLHRDSAMAAIDALLGLDQFSQNRLAFEVSRFRGFRGVRQLRALVPLADRGSESFGESALRLRWYDAGLGRPSTQIEVTDAEGHYARLDLGSPRWLYAAEYDGERFHGPDRAVHDESRRTWLSDEHGWFVDVFRRNDVFGNNQTATMRLRHGMDRARLRMLLRSSS